MSSKDCPFCSFQAVLSLVSESFLTRCADQYSADDWSGDPVWISGTLFVKLSLLRIFALQSSLPDHSVPSPQFQEPCQAEFIMLLHTHKSTVSFLTCPLWSSPPVTLLQGGSMFPRLASLSTSSYGWPLLSLSPSLISNGLSSPKDGKSH